MKETSMSSERKVAVITGASRGMGAALVEAYRGRDYGVVATARSIRPTNDDQILVVPGDITDRKTAERAISEGLARFGRIDTLINNAGVFVAKPFTQNLFESAYCAGARTGIGLSSASKPERTPTKARRAAETSSRPARSRARPPQWDSQPKLRSTTHRRASTTKPLAAGSRATTRWRMPWRFDHSRQRSAANAPS